VGGSDDDIGDGGSNTDFDAGVAFFGEFTLEEFVQFGEEDTIYENDPSVILFGKDSLIRCSTPT